MADTLGLIGGCIVFLIYLMGTNELLSAVSYQPSWRIQVLKLLVGAFLGVVVYATLARGNGM